MNHFSTDGTFDTPKVSLNPDTGSLIFEGKSLPENVTKFYNPIIEWLDNYLSSTSTKVVLEFNLSYFNTASSKIILDILMLADNYSSKGNDTLIVWHYNEEDEDMEEAGYEYSEIVEDLPFEFKPYVPTEA